MPISKVSPKIAAVGDRILSLYEEEGISARAIAEAMDLSKDGVALFIRAHNKKALKCQICGCDLPKGKVSLCDKQECVRERRKQTNRAHDQKRRKGLQRRKYARSSLAVTPRKPRLVECNRNGILCGHYMECLDENSENNIPGDGFIRAEKTGGACYEIIDTRKRKRDELEEGLARISEVVGVWAGDACGC